MTKSKKNNSNKRQFNYTDTALYNGSSYPSARAYVDDGNGNMADTTIFVGDDNQYYTTDSQGNAYPVMLQHELPEVVVKLSKRNSPFKSLTTPIVMSNDNTQILSTPHREYNPHLVDGALRGARYHAQWDKQHPNLSQWRDLATAIPFAVAATPLAVGGADALAATALGQSVTNGLGLMASAPAVQTLLPWADAALTSMAGASGIHDVTHGKFTPGTAMDLMPLAQLANTGKGIKGIIGTTSKEGRSSQMSVTQSPPTSGELNSLEPVNLFEENTELPISEELAERVRPLLQMRPSRSVTDGLTPLERTRAELQAMRENPSLRPMSRQEGEEVINRELPFFQDGTPNSNYLEPSSSTPHRFYSDNDVDNVISTEDVNLNDDLLSSGNTSYTTFRARDTRKGELPYTDEEINALVNEDGTLKRGIKISQDSQVYTGSHGKFYHSPEDFGVNSTSPTQILKYHLGIDTPSASNELKDIMLSNPTGRSGILIKTHSGDTSIDSTPLAYSMAIRLGKKFKPLKQKRFSFSSDSEPSSVAERVISNNYGYNSIFAEDKATADRARALFEKYPFANVTLLKDAEGNMTAYKLTDEDGDFLIPLRSRQGVLDIMNKRLHNFNRHYGTSYEDIIPYSNAAHDKYNPQAPYPWFFGESFDLPDIYGISYKKGGKLYKRKGLTF